MPNSLDKLASIGGPALGITLLSRDALPILCLKNGFMAFDSALSVLPSDSLSEWNRKDGWRSAYPNLALEATCFASDIFGNQFASIARHVYRLDAESAEVELFADSFEEWADIILGDFDLHTGHSLAHAWQTTIRPLGVGERLAPIQPFVLGGEFEVSNLSAMNSTELMQRYGRFARSLGDLPDGVQVAFDEEHFVVRPIF